MKLRARRDGGFTMLELMIAVAIIGTLAAVAIPSFRNYQWKAKRSEAFTNLGSLAKTQKAYFGSSEVFLTVPIGEPGLTLGNVPTDSPRDSAAVATAFATIGWAAEGQVYFDYDTNTPAGIGGCACVGQCFTASAYGDIDGDLGMSAIMYVHPDAGGGTCTSSMFGYTTPIDANALPIFDQVAANRGAADDY